MLRCCAQGEDKWWPMSRENLTNGHAIVRLICIWAPGHYVVVYDSRVAHHIIENMPCAAAKNIPPFYICRKRGFHNDPYPRIRRAFWMDYWHVISSTSS